MVIAIIACEIAFWVFVAAGLAVRYALRKPRLGGALLVCVPIVDLVLLTLIVIDLRSGATAEWSHGLGAIYLGLSITYGHSMVRWADGWAAQWFDKVQRTPKPKLYGTQHIRQEWMGLGKWLIAVAISAAVLYVCILLVGDPARSAALESWFGTLGMVTVIWLIITVSYTIWPRKEPEALRSPT